MESFVDGEIDIKGEVGELRHSENAEGEEDNDFGDTKRADEDDDKDDADDSDEDEWIAVAGTFEISKAMGGFDLWVYFESICLTLPEKDKDSGHCDEEEERYGGDVIGGCNMDEAVEMNNFWSWR